MYGQGFLLVEIALKLLLGEQLWLSQSFDSLQVK